MAITGSLKLSVFMLLYTCDVLMEKINYKKKYGQNFLYDDNILEKIVKSTKINEDDLIIENGGKTIRLLDRNKKEVLLLKRIQQ